MYAKVFSSLFDGSMRGQPDLILVFINMLTRCDSDGCVDRTPRAIADETGLPIERVKDAIKMLESPDSESRTPDMEGRRIVLISGERTWGWRIVNFRKYRSIRDEQSRQQQNREAQQRYKSKTGKPESAKVSQEKPDKPVKAHTEAEAEAHTKTETKNTCADKSPRARNPLLDSLASVEGDPLQTPSAQWSRISKALSEIKSASPDVTPEEIKRRASNYKSHFEDAMLTCNALAKWWAKCEKSAVSKSGMRIPTAEEFTLVAQQRGTNRAEA